MTILWVNLAIVFAFAAMARYFSVPVFNGSTNVQPNKIMAAAVAATLVVVSGLRSNIGDTYFYKHAYKVGDFSWAALADQSDRGFRLFQMLLKQLSDDPQILLFATALITNVLIVITLYQYSRLFEMSIFIYIASGAFLVSMNGMRQYLAASIVFAATKALFAGNWKLYMLITVFASLFHQSALVMIPVYFIVRREAWKSSTFLMLLLAIGIVLGYNYFSELFFKAIEDTQYGYYNSFKEGGANFIRVLVTAAPLVVAYMGREKLKEICPYSDIVVNLSILGTVIMIISSQNWIFARLSIYFNLYQLLLIGWLVPVFRKKDHLLMYFLLIALYLIFFIYEHVIVLNINYKSDYLIF
ncbi:EpsG family protein [Paenibacillus sp. GXUN7292]|uniref:EpsG family protein n=1 Tax=Paenibacillus sp. GXUN7292 TaxID=3422499 RepID=UPI003D7CFDF0